MIQRGLTILALFLAFAGGIFAQAEELTETSEAAKENERYDLLIEYLEIEGELQDIKSRVMEDEEIRRQKKFLDSQLEMNLVAKKPDLIQRIKKYNELSEELEGTELQDEPEKWGEMKTLELDLDNRKKELLKNSPELQEAKKNFDELVEAKMIELDPTVAEKVERMKEIKDKIRQD